MSSSPPSLACDDDKYWNETIALSISPEAVKFRLIEDPECPTCAFVYYASPTSLHDTQWYPAADAVEFSVVPQMESIKLRERILKNTHPWFEPETIVVNPTEAPTVIGYRYRYLVLNSEQIQADGSTDESVIQEFLIRYKSATPEQRKTLCNGGCSNSNRAWIKGQGIEKRIGMACTNVMRKLLIPTAVSASREQGQWTPFVKMEDLYSMSTNHRFQPQPGTPEYLRFILNQIPSVSHDILIRQYLADNDAAFARALARDSAAGATTSVTAASTSTTPFSTDVTLSNGNMVHVDVSGSANISLSVPSSYNNVNTNRTQSSSVRNHTPTRLDLDAFGTPTSSSVSSSAPYVSIPSTSTTSLARPPPSVPYPSPSAPSPPYTQFYTPVYTPVGDQYTPSYAPTPTTTTTTTSSLAQRANSPLIGTYMYPRDDPRYQVVTPKPHIYQAYRVHNHIPSLDPRQPNYNAYPRLY